MSNQITDLLEGLAACLCAQIATDGSPGTCFCGVVPGDAALGDYAGDCADLNGVAWVRLALTYPSVTIGQQDQRVANCGSGIGIDVEMGIIRSFDVDVDSPDEAEALATATLQMDDMMTMRRAILCCSDLNPKDFILGSYRPLGPLGAMVGGAWTLYVGLA